MKRRRVTFLPGAQEDLREIAGYITDRDGSRAALAFTSEVEVYCLGFDIFRARRHATGWQPQYRLQPESSDLVPSEGRPRRDRQDRLRRAMHRLKDYP